MQKELLNTYALNKDNRLVSVYEAIKGEEYFCPVCKEKFAFKCGEIKRKHFAHTGENNSDHDNESFIHQCFKYKLKETIEDCLSNSKPLSIKWTCKGCNSTYNENLLAKVARVEVEYTLENTRPDVALLDKDNNVLFALEVVVTHAPEEATLQYYHDKGIILVQYNIDTDFDLENSFMEKLENPDEVSFCDSSNCSKFSMKFFRQSYHNNKMHCDKCNTDYNYYYKILSCGFGDKFIYDLTAEDRKIVSDSQLRKKDVVDKNNKFQAYADYCQCREMSSNEILRYFYLTRRNRRFYI